MKVVENVWIGLAFINMGIMITTFFIESVYLSAVWYVLMGMMFLFMVIDMHATRKKRIPGFIYVMCVLATLSFIVMGIMEIR